MPQQDDLIERAKEIYLSTGARWQDQKKLFAMPHGGRIRFRPLESVTDAEKYQGQSLSDAAVEEAGNYPMPAPIDRLFGCLRSAHGVPIQRFSVPIQEVLAINGSSSVSLIRLRLE